MAWELGLIGDELDRAGQVMGIAPEKVDELKSVLGDIVSTLSDDTYSWMGTIASGSFGGNGTAEQLAYHHGRAHQVMNDTLKGFLKDLHDFTAYLHKSVELLEHSDWSSEQQLSVKRQLIKEFRGLEHHAHDESNNHSSRQHINPGPRVNGGR